MSETTPPITIEVLQAWADASPFIAFCQMTVESVDAEKGIVEMKMPLTDALSRGGEPVSYTHLTLPTILRV